MSDLPFLDSEEPEVTETPEPVAQAPEPVAETVETPPEPVRDDKGRFAPKDKADEPMVPLKALLETRDEVRALKAQITPAKPEPETIPDIWEDQNGFTNGIINSVDQRIHALNLNWSHRAAVQQHGKEAVEAALAWGQQRCAADPSFNAAVFQNPDPVGFAVEQYHREQIAEKVTMTEFEEFQAWKAAQAQAQTTTPPEPQQAPPRSIASLPSSGGASHVPVGPGQAFDTLFANR